jgi:hypothetical protein
MKGRARLLARFVGRARGCPNRAELANNEGKSVMSVLQFPEGRSADFSSGEVYFIGNATTLIRFGGITILTDPAFLHKGQHVDLGHGI